MNFMWRESRAKNSVAEHLKEQKGTSGLSEIGYFCSGKRKKTNAERSLNYRGASRKRLVRMERWAVISISRGL